MHSIMLKRRHHASMYFPRAIESRALRGFCLRLSVQPQQPQCDRSSLNATAATPRRVRRKLLRGTQRPNTIPASSEGALSKEKSHFGWSVNRRQECTRSSEHGPVILSYGIKKVPWEGLTQEHLPFAYSLVVFSFSARLNYCVQTGNVKMLRI